MYSQFVQRIERIQKESYSRIYNELKLIFIQLEKCEASSELVERVTEQINSAFKISDVVTFSGNYQALFESIQLAIKHRADCRVDLTASEIVDLIEYDIYNNFINDVTSSNLLEEYGYNEVYLANLFKQNKGITPKKLLQQVRIEKAKEIIELNPKIMLKDVSEMVGFNDQLYFSRIFKERVGISPRDYAKKHEKNSTHNL